MFFQERVARWRWTIMHGADAGFHGGGLQVICWEANDVGETVGLRWLRQPRVGW